MQVLYFQQTAKVIAEDFMEAFSIGKETCQEMCNICFVANGGDVYSDTESF